MSMGLIVTKQRLKKQTDFLKFRALYGNPVVRKAVAYALERDKGGKMRLERILDDIASGDGRRRKAGLRDRIVRKMVDMVMKGIGIEDEEQARFYASHPNIRRTVINALLGAHTFGIKFPFIFYAPLMIVWNITWRCNLRCRHCYEDAGPLREKGLCWDELSTEEKLAFVDEVAESYIPALSFSGGEPLICPDFWKVVERARERGLYISMNTNGTLITPEVARRLKELDLAYVAVSLDAPVPEVHDRFRGVPGAWERAVQGIRNCVEAGLTTVISFTINATNLCYLKDMMRLTEELGAFRLMVYNIIPVGRAGFELDLTPEQREKALKEMYDYLAEGGSLCTTAPQLGRFCKMGERPDLVPLAHLGTGKAKELGIIADIVGGCGIARAYMAVQPNGDITPCVYMPEVVLGNVKRDRLIDIWHNHPFLKELRDRSTYWGNCGTCDYKEVCGGCRARAFHYFGDAKGPDPGCILNRKFYYEVAEKVGAPTGGRAQEPAAEAAS